MNSRNLSVNYSDKLISNFSIARFALWNQGKDTINKNDIAKNFPLKITIKEPYEILDCEIIYVKNIANSFEINIISNELFINFDYFDYLEGVIIQIYHTGKTDTDFLFTGSIKSVKTIQKASTGFISQDLSFNFNSNSRNLWGISYIIMGVSMLIFSLFYSIKLNPLLHGGEYKINYIALICLSLLSIFPIIVGYKGLKGPIPRGFDVFNIDV